MNNFFLGPLNRCLAAFQPKNFWQDSLAAKLEMGWADKLVIAEQSRWPLFIPVCFGVGVALYFRTPVAYPWILCSVAFGLGLAAWAAWPRYPLLFGGLAALGLVLAGLVYTQFRSELMRTPMLSQDVTAVITEATVTRLERISKGRIRFWLSDIHTDKPLPLTGGQVSDFTLRISTSAKGEWQVGDRLTMKARLIALSPPSWPHGYDFRRDMYFEAIGASGYSYTTPQKLHPQTPEAVVSSRFGLGLSLQQIDNWRYQIAERINRTLSGQEGAIAIGLVVGQREEIKQDTNDNFRDSGLAHILSISGLHLTIAAGLVFTSLRFLLALGEIPALYGHTKKWAAWLAIPSVVFYSLLSGASVPAIRAMVMTCLGLLAIGFDRRVLTMRPLAMAVMLVLLMTPQALVGASFQLSFASVLLLVAFAERDRQIRLAESSRRQQQDDGLLGLGLEGGAVVIPPNPPSQWLHLISSLPLVKSLRLMINTSLIASLATAPLIIWHFGQITLAGVLANMIAIPLTGLWIMPALCLSLLFMPLGLDEWPLLAAGEGIKLLIMIADYMGNLPYAVWPIHPPRFGSMLAAIGLVIPAIIWQSRARFIPLIMACALFIGDYAIPLKLPDIVVSPDGLQVGVIANNGLWALHAKRQKYILNNWQQRTGLPLKGDFEALSQQRPDLMQCEDQGCLFTPYPSVIPNKRPLTTAFSDSFEGARKFCRKADMTLALVRKPVFGCDGNRYVATAQIPSQAWQFFWLDSDEILRKTGRQDVAPHPWN